MKRTFISALFILSVIFIASCISEDEDKEIIDTDPSGESQSGDTGSPSDTTDSGTNDPDKTDTASESGDEDKTDTASGHNDEDTVSESGDNDKNDTDPEQNDEDNTDSASEHDDSDSTDSTEEPATSDPTGDSANSTGDSDPETGLIALADWSASSPQKTDWNGAYNYCSAMTEGGHNWRLPTISELRQLVQNCAGTEYNGACGVKDGHLKESDYTYNECAKCTNRYDGGYSKLGDKDYLWSASELDGDPSKVWVINFKSANIGTLAKDTAEYGYARCVKE